VSSSTYGFQGQETDQSGEFGSGDMISYKYRVHDPRIGRFFSVDPLTSKYPFYSPYSFSGNRVIDRVELEGLEPADPQNRNIEGQTGTATQKNVGRQGGESTDEFNWYWHTGTERDQAGWYKENDYFQVTKRSIQGNGRYGKGVEFSSEFGVVAGAAYIDNNKINMNWIDPVTGESGRNPYFVGNGIEPVYIEADLVFIGRGLGKWVVQRLAARQGPKAVISSADDFTRLFKPQHELDFTKTLYRGTTGSEKSGSFLFLTDDASVAATYVENGGRVMSYEVTNYSLYNLEQRGLLEVLPDIHMIGGKEIRHTTFLFKDGNIRKALNQIAK
jgi:RHS repeat-associated protein